MTYQDAVRWAEEITDKTYPLKTLRKRIALSLMDATRQQSEVCEQLAWDSLAIGRNLACASIRRRREQDAETLVDTKQQIAASGREEKEGA